MDSGRYPKRPGRIWLIVFILIGVVISVMQSIGSGASAERVKLDAVVLVVAIVVGMLFFTLTAEFGKRVFTNPVWAGLIGMFVGLAMGYLALSVFDLNQIDPSSVVVKVMGGFFLSFISGFPLIAFIVRGFSWEHFPQILIATLAGTAVSLALALGGLHPANPWFVYAVCGLSGLVMGYQVHLKNRRYLEGSVPS